MFLFRDMSCNCPFLLPEWLSPFPRRAPWVAAELLREQSLKIELWKPTFQPCEVTSLCDDLGDSASSTQSAQGGSLSLDVKIYSWSFWSPWGRTVCIGAMFLSLRAKKSDQENPMTFRWWLWGLAQDPSLPLHYLKKKKKSLGFW